MKCKIDISKISWVISNLIANAIRYIPKDGTGFVKISIKEIYGKQIVSISDNGTGINETLQKHIFENSFKVPIVQEVLDLVLQFAKKLLTPMGVIFG